MLAEIGGHEPENTCSKYEGLEGWVGSWEREEAFDVFIQDHECDSVHLILGKGEGVDLVKNFKMIGRMCMMCVGACVAARVFVQRTT